MERLIIEFKNVNKKFKKGTKLLLKEALLDILKPAQTEDFYALRNVSFSVSRGESFGIIGPNGSGKSTVLKLIAGVIISTSGSVNVRGNVAPLIELGAGFHPELTGRENIYLNATILGITKKEVDKKYDQIVDFSELKEFIDTPVKHYSSGMYMRLGFSVAIHTSPDILLVDEILAVGDSKFQKKCMRRMNDFKKQGVTVVFITHDMEVIKSFCDRVMVIANGEASFIGSPKKAAELYEK